MMSPYPVIMVSKSRNAAFAMGLLLGLAACARMQTQETTTASRSADTYEKKLEDKIESLNQRIQVLEDRISKVSKPPTLAATAGSLLDPPPIATTLKAVPSVPHPASQLAPMDPSADAQDSRNLSIYRKAMTLFEGNRLSESIESFSEFLQLAADHPLAGSAQYHIGESYFKQREYKLAQEEFQRVLVSYDRSIYVSDALKRLADTQELLQNPQDAILNRRTLLTLFPHSPAARELLNSKAPAPAASTEAEPMPTAPLPAESSSDRSG